MTMEQHFAIYNEKDFHELKTMILAFYEEKSYDQSMSEKKILLTINELIKNSNKGKIVLFKAGGITVGYAIIIYSWSNEYGGNIVTIDEMYVKPSWRNQGVGSAFLTYITDPKDTSVRGFQLEVRPLNDNSLTFFLKHDFIQSENRLLVKIKNSI